jgi:predicted AAA+ superfamily ATPase
MSNELIHSGKKGMKWGIRKSTTSADYNAVRPIRKQSYKKLSNEELKTVISRMQLEKQYRDLNPRGASKAAKTVVDGHKTAIALMAVGTSLTAAYAWSKSSAGQSVIANITSKLVK